MLVILPDKFELHAPSEPRHHFTLALKALPKPQGMNARNKWLIRRDPSTLRPSQQAMRRQLILYNEYQDSLRWQLRQKHVPIPPMGITRFLVIARFSHDVYGDGDNLRKAFQDVLWPHRKGGDKRVRGQVEAELRRGQPDEMEVWLW